MDKVAKPIMLWRVLSALEEHLPLSSADVTGRTGISPSGTRTRLRELADMTLVNEDRLGFDKMHYWPTPMGRAVRALPADKAQIVLQRMAIPYRDLVAERAAYMAPHWDYWQDRFSVVMQNVLNNLK